MNKALFNRSKFTLIELLVVISIIGILASMLMPSLSNARLKSQIAVCKSNLKQMFIGQMIYADDNGGRVMATEYGAEWIDAKTWVDLDTGDWNNFHDGTKGFLEPYMGPQSSQVCQ